VSIFPAVHSERLSPGSFQQPVPIPTAAPGQPSLIQVCFNRDWLPYVLGCLFQLTLNTTWIAADQSELNSALQAANDLILIFQKALAQCNTGGLGSSGAGGDDFMLRQNPDNPCLLETSVDGVTWCVWADISKCTGQPQQPAKGAGNPPSGGCMTSYATVEFGSRWMLPQNVSTGDVITVSNAVGTWASALDLFLPRCPDGNLFFEVGCVSGSGHTEGGDPAPAINHDSLIAFDGTNYYDCGPASDNTPVVITIPSGISNANLFFFANTPDTSGFGAVNCDVQYCNNAVPSWSHVLNLASSPGGFVDDPQYSCISGDFGSWQAGQGWVQGYCLNSITHYENVSIELVFSTTYDIDSVLWTYDATIDPANAGTDVHDRITYRDGGGTQHVTTDITNGTGTNLAVGDTSPRTAKAIGVQIGVGSVDTPTTPTGTARVFRLTVSGHGPDPFGP
jgi:hypothetical protein